MKTHPKWVLLGADTLVGREIREVVDDRRLPVRLRACGSAADQRVLSLESEDNFDVLEELSAEIHDRGITIDNRLGAIPAGSVQVSAHKTWLKIVFRNLFTNAIKYGGRGCTIAFGFEDRASHYRLNVYNSGVPIKEGDRDRLFTKFGRIGAESGGIPGSIGLGLYLVREILRKHGGDIWYEATADGSDFVFTLPKERAGEDR